MLKNKDLLRQLDPESLDIFMDDVIKKYSKGPKCLENICLAEYVACYNLSKRKASSNKENDVDDNFEEEITGKECSRNLNKRDRPLVI